MWRAIAARYPDRVGAQIGFDESLAHLIEGGSDLFLMPSLFEPCGLGQLIAMRFGSVPVVRSTGGLADTVRDGQTGFTFDAFTVDAFWMAVQRALLVQQFEISSTIALRVFDLLADFTDRLSFPSHLDRRKSAGE
jgi:starch synthase